MTTKDDKVKRCLDTQWGAEIQNSKKNFDEK
jgi:hypothetical protein